MKAHLYALLSTMAFCWSLTAIIYACAHYPQVVAPAIFGILLILVILSVYGFFWSLFQE